MPAQCRRISACAAAAGYAQTFVHTGLKSRRTGGRMRSALCRGDEIGKHSGLKSLSARSETAGAEPFKFGETPGARRAEATPSQARMPRECRREGVETRRRAPKVARADESLAGDGEGIVQRTNGSASAAGFERSSVTKIRRLDWLAGSSPVPGTISLTHVAPRKPEKPARRRVGGLF